MRNFMSVGVFGLIPVLPPDTLRSTYNNRRATRPGIDEWQLLLLDPLLSERMATREELARVREELKEFSTKPAE